MKKLLFIFLLLIPTIGYALNPDSTRVQIRYGNAGALMLVYVDSLGILQVDSVTAIVGDSADVVRAYARLIASDTSEVYFLKLVDSLTTKATIASLNAGLALKLNLTAFDDSVKAHLQHIDSLTFTNAQDSSQAITFADWVANPGYDGSDEDTIVVAVDMEKIAGTITPKMSAYMNDTTIIIQTVDIWSPIVTVPVGYNGLRKISGFVKTTVNKADTNNISLILYEVVAGDTVFCDSLLNVATAGTWNPFSFNDGSSWGIYTFSADSVFPSKTDAGDAANLVDGNTGTTWTLNSGGSAQVVFKTVDGNGIQLDSIRVYTDTGTQTVTVAGTNDSTNVGWDTLATIIQANGAWQGALPQSDSTYQFIRLSWSNALAVVGEVEMYEITSNTDINRDESFILRARMKSMMSTRIAELGLLKYHWGN